MPSHNNKNSIQFNLIFVVQALDYYHQRYSRDASVHQRGSESACHRRYASHVDFFNKKKSFSSFWCVYALAIKQKFNLKETRVGADEKFPF